MVSSVWVPQLVPGTIRGRSCPAWCYSHLFYRHNLSYHDLLSTACNFFWFQVMPWRQHSGTDETSVNCTDCTFSCGKDTILYCKYSMERPHFGKNCINYTFSSQWISKQTNAVSRSNRSQTMLDGVYGCFMTGNVFLAGNNEVSLELQCFTAELITYIVCECDAPEWLEQSYTHTQCVCARCPGMILNITTAVRGTEWQAWHLPLMLLILNQEVSLSLNQSRNAVINK